MQPDAVVTVAGPGGRYVLTECIGRGGVGAVFRAHDTHLDRWVAIKKLYSETAGSDALAEIALHEAKNLAALQHPNIVTVHDFFEEAGDVMVVMEFIHGRTLQEIGESAPLVVEDFIELAFQSLEGIGAAHSLGMIHRDMKPSNIMLAHLACGRFQVKLLDFGLAKIISKPSLQTVYQSDSLLGSIYTMAPEQLEFQPLDARTDLYSLGCAYYYALTTTFPFSGDSVPVVISAHLNHAFVPLAHYRNDLPLGMSAWVEKMFSRLPDDRPDSAQSAAMELRAILESKPSAVQRPAGRPVAAVLPAPDRRRFPWGWVAGVGSALGALAAGAVLAFGSRQDVAPAAVKASIEAPVAATLGPGQRGALLSKLGQKVIVEGLGGRIGENKAGTIRYLNFANSTRGDLALVFFLKDSHGAFDREKLEPFVGKKLRVTGTVSEYEDDPQIVISSLDQIQILP